MCLKEDFRVFLEGFKGFKEVSMVFQESFNGVSKLKSVSRKIQ